MLNGHLDMYQAKVFDAKRKLIESNQIVSASAIKRIFLGNDERLFLIFSKINIYV